MLELVRHIAGTGTSKLVSLSNYGQTQSVRASMSRLILLELVYPVTVPGKIGRVSPGDLLTILLLVNLGGFLLVTS